MTKPEFRTRVGNGKAVLAGVDQRSHGARRHREIVESITAELGPGLTEIDKLRVMTAACWVVMSEDLTARMVRGETVDPEAITRAVNGASRALAALKKQAAAKKPASTSINDWLARRA